MRLFRVHSLGKESKPESWLQVWPVSRLWFPALSAPKMPRKIPAFFPTLRRWGQSVCGFKTKPAVIPSSTLALLCTVYTCICSQITVSSIDIFVSLGNILKEFVYRVLKSETTGNKWDSCCDTWWIGDVVAVQENTETCFWQPVVQLKVLNASAYYNCSNFRKSGRKSRTVYISFGPAIALTLTLEGKIHRQNICQTLERTCLNVVVLGRSISLLTLKWLFLFFGSLVLAKKENIVNSRFYLENGGGSGCGGEEEEDREERK